MVGKIKKGDTATATESLYSCDHKRKLNSVVQPNAEKI